VASASLLSAVPSDAETLAGVAARDLEAFQCFFDTWFPRVYAFALDKLGSRVLAEAVTRRSLRAALAELSGLDSETPVAPWLLGHLRREIAFARRPTPP
jgi:DNA-directed RNA polymerase specialized sigma24 family protein